MATINVKTLILVIASILFAAGAASKNDLWEEFKERKHFFLLFFYRVFIPE